MKNWTEKHIRSLLNDQKITGHRIPERSAHFSEGKKIQITEKPKGLIWLEWNLQYWCNQHATSLEKEFKFCERGWRFDFALPADGLKIAVEYEGGIFMAKSGHNTAKHYTKDTEKYNRAAVMGWRVIRVTALNYTTAINQLNEMINNDGKK